MLALKRFAFVVIVLITASSLYAVRRADVILNDEIVPLGMLDGMLKARGFEVTIFPASSLDQKTLMDRNADLLIILGGRQSVTRIEDGSYFHDEIALIQHRHWFRQPTLGLCLGAQLIAIALGGHVMKGPVVEQGWITLESTSSSAQSPAVQSLLDSQTKVYASHEDAVVKLPFEAVLLAKSNLYDHIFSVGPAFAIQFHPEATPDITKNWLMLFGKPEEVEGKHKANEIAFAQYKEGIERFWSLYLDELEAELGPSVE